MIWRCDYYALDCGRKYLFCPLRITAPAALIPVTLLSLLQTPSLGHCPLPVVARRVNLTMNDGEIFFIEYPFNSSMSEWTNFWQQLRENPTIINLSGIGESISDSPLRNWLFS